MGEKFEREEKGDENNNKLKDEADGPFPFGTFLSAANK